MYLTPNCKNKIRSRLEFYNHSDRLDLKILDFLIFFSPKNSFKFREKKGGGRTTLLDSSFIIYSRTNLSYNNNDD